MYAAKRIANLGITLLRMQSAWQPGEESSGFMQTLAHQAKHKTQFSNGAVLHLILGVNFRHQTEKGIWGFSSTGKPNMIHFGHYIPTQSRGAGNHTFKSQSRDYFDQVDSTLHVTDNQSQCTPLFLPGHCQKPIAKPGSREYVRTKVSIYIISILHDAICNHTAHKKPTHHQKNCT